MQVGHCLDKGLYDETTYWDEDVCFHCHQPGHKARKCPLLHPELKKEPRMKEKKNITDLQIRDRVMQRLHIHA